MQDRWYLLSLEYPMHDVEKSEAKTVDTENQNRIYAKINKQEILQEAARRLDGERRRKLEHCKSERKQLECIGAGLLLQLAVREALSEVGRAESADKVHAASKAGIAGKVQAAGEETAVNSDATRFSIAQLTLSQLLQEAQEPQEPLPLEYFYGSHGKPYLKNYPFYFNISHSGEYVLCVLSEQEVGVDIQWKASQVNESVLKRFFSPQEKAYWESCSGESERRDFFYQMWCRKEAYGKLTGKGIGNAVSINMYFPELPIVIEEYCDLTDYQIAVCHSFH